MPPPTLGADVATYPEDRSGDVETVMRWEGSGEDEVERTLGLLVRGDVVSCLLAEAEGVDALDIARLTSLKGL